MPPRSAKKTAGPRKTASRTPRATSKAQIEAEVVEEPVEVERIPAPIELVKEEGKVEEIVVRDKPFDLNSSEIERDSVEAECKGCRFFRHQFCFCLLLELLKICLLLNLVTLS